MTDADLDVLGREDFMLSNERLRRELALLGQEFSDLDWYMRQLKFIQSHSYFTASAHALRDGGQSANIQILKQRLDEINDDLEQKITS